VFSGDLLPQHGTVGELGASFDAGGAVARLSAYRMDLSDEIDFDGVSFANVNLPATRRQGVDAEIDSPAIAGVKAHAAYTYIDARFRQGINAGNEIPLVARNKASGRLTSYNGEIGTYSLTATYVSHRPYSGDFASQRGSLAGYLTVDLQGRWTLGRWALIAKLVNAFDRRYAPFAGYSTFVNDYYYFPADGRSAFLSARYDFH
jgi:iron complex outermembrane receptor protein